MTCYRDRTQRHIPWLGAPVQFRSACLRGLSSARTLVTGRPACILYHVMTYSSARTVFQICCRQGLTQRSPALSILYGGNVDMLAFLTLMRMSAMNNRRPVLTKAEFQQLSEFRYQMRSLNVFPTRPRKAKALRPCSICCCCISKALPVETGRTSENWPSVCRRSIMASSQWFLGMRRGDLSGALCVVNANTDRPLVDRLCGRGSPIS